MPTNNSWLTPYQRSFNSIKKQLLTSLRKNAPEITDYTEGNVLILVISIFSAIAEVIHYYIDNMARETFFTTARRYSSLYKHAKLVDYHIKAGVPASTDLTLSYENPNHSASESIEIPIGTKFTSDDGKVWINTKRIEWAAGLQGVVVPVVQMHEARTDISLGTITYQGIAIQLGNIPADQFYVEGSMVLNVDGVTWTLVDTFAYASPLDKVYKVELNADMIPTIYFGDNINGMMPSINSKLTGSYSLTYGAASNIEAESFSSVPSEIQSVDPRNKMVIHQYNKAAGGSNYEDFNALKRRVPLSIKTLGVAITKEDFENIAMLQNGVLKAYAKYICGRYVQVFIVPDDYGVASNWLIQEVQQKLQQSKVITTAVQVYPVYIGHLRFSMEVWGNKSFTSLEINKQITQALQEKFSWENAELNTVVKVSDVYALIDNLPVVDYVNIQGMDLLTEPYLSMDAGSNLSPNLKFSYFDIVKWGLTQPLKFDLHFMSKADYYADQGLQPEDPIVQEEEGMYYTKLVLTYSEELKTLLETYPDLYQWMFDYTNVIHSEGSSAFYQASSDLNLERMVGIGYRDAQNRDAYLFQFIYKFANPEQGTYQEGDTYTWFLSKPSAGENLNTTFDTDGTSMYLPVFVNESGDLKLEIHETL